MIWKERYILLSKIIGLTIAFSFFFNIKLALAIAIFITTSISMYFRAFIRMFSSVKYFYRIHERYNEWSLEKIQNIFNKIKEIGNDSSKKRK